MANTSTKLVEGNPAALPSEDRRGKFGAWQRPQKVWHLIAACRCWEIVLPEKTDAVIGFRADPELQARIEELARKSTEGELTEDERAEYAGYVRANKFVAILKRQAQQITQGAATSNCRS